MIETVVEVAAIPTRVSDRCRNLRKVVDLCVVPAAKHLQQKGLDEADALRLAASLSEKLSPPLTEPAAIDVSGADDMADRTAV